MVNRLQQVPSDSGGSPEVEILSRWSKIGVKLLTNPKYGGDRLEAKIPFIIDRHMASMFLSERFISIPLR